MSGVRTQNSERSEYETPGLLIRPMRIEDVDEIGLMERLIFPSPWSRQAFVDEIKEGAGTLSLVARLEGLLAGYLVAWFVLDEAHLGNIAVNPELRRRQVATGLMKRLIEEADARMVTRMTLEVRVSNVGAIRLYRNFGFRAVSMRRGYYVDNREDAFVMLRDKTVPVDEV
ncbi:MAG: ribosomal protein S18-alanine N-acetyltransferase [Candidatus Eisenbacteria bacterium]|nr:ribosomal protein S18-alanine N-acetyltransferase [Candidatus Eisenbacteria bacterium]